MNTAERAKTIIAEYLSNYLLPDKVLPERIGITVSYAQSSAHLCWETERIEKILNDIVKEESK